ncbi:MAG: hypothetical protein PVF73_08585 [Bacteroidales bacterium]|jgi:hypothetical protein
MMFRLVIHTALSFILLMTTSGFTLSAHYCGNEMVSLSLNKEKEPCCGMDGCCHNETEHYQLKENFVPSVEEFDFTFHVFVELEGCIPLLLGAVENEGLGDSGSLADESPPPGDLHSVLSFLQTYRL